MFCKNCGKEIKGTEKFCPACGSPVSVPPRKDEETKKKAVKQKEADISVKPAKADTPAKPGKSPKKYLKVLLPGVVCAVAVILILVKAVGGFQSAGDTKSGGFQKETYKDSGFSRKQIKELENTYNQAYEDEKEALDLYIMAFAESYDEYGYLKEGLEQLPGLVENLYQVVNDLDPQLKEVVAQDAGMRYGDSYLEYYLIDKGVGTVLSDSSVGKDLRSLITNAGVGLLEYALISQSEQEKREAIRSDAMEPVAVSEEYALIRSYGNIGEMLRQIENNSGYVIARKALQQRQDAIDEGFKKYALEDYWSEDLEVSFQAYQNNENLQGRNDAVNEKIAEWNDALYQWEKEFLQQMGLEDVDALLQERIYPETAEGENVSQEDTEEDLQEDSEKDSQGASAETLGRYVYSITDKEGKIYSSFLWKYGIMEAVINNEGVFSMPNGPEGIASANNVADTPHIIMNKEAKILFESETTEGGSIYYDVTPSGNILKKSYDSDMQHGDYQILEFVQPDGTTKKLLEGGFIELGQKEKYRDYYSYECGYVDDRQGTVYGYIDMKTGELIDKEEYEKKIQEEFPGEEESGIPRVIEEVRMTRLNENYLIGDDSILYDNAKKAVKELSEGRGVENIQYGDGKYWVVAKSGWYYALDENLEEILEPVQLPKDTSYTMTDYGIVTVESVEIETEGSQYTENYICLYDEKGERTQLVKTNDTSVQVSGFMVTSVGGFGTVWTSPGANLKTKEPLLIATPETPISLEM